MYENQYGTDASPDTALGNGQLSQLEYQLAQLRERLAQSTGELGSIADRCFGTQPQPVPTKAPGGVAGAGVVHRIDAEICAFEAEIGAIEERVKRLCAL